MVSWCGPVNPIKLPRHVQIVNSYGQDDNPLCVCAHVISIFIMSTYINAHFYTHICMYIYIHMCIYIYIYATHPKTKRWFLPFVCSSLEMHQPTFWLYQLLEKHCVDSTHIYIHIRVYIYIQYIYNYTYMLTPPIPTLKHFLGRIYVVIFVH